jgi:hypothetical protein
MTTARLFLTGLVAAAVMGCAGTASESPGASQSVTTTQAVTTAAVTTAATTTTEAATTAAVSSSLGFELPHNAAELEKLLPDTIAGDTLTKFSWSGPDFVKTASTDNAEFVAWLQSLGKSLNDVSAAGAFDIPLTTSASTSGGSILAFRVNGVDHNTLISSFQTAAAKGMTNPPTWTSATVGGKSVQQAPSESGDLTQYLYGAADIVFVVASSNQAWATEALSKLP